MINVIDELRRLDLPSGEYVVVGSSVLAVKDIRQANDIDILVTGRLYKNLKKAGWQERRFEGSLRELVLFKDCFDVSMSWSVEGYEPDPIVLIQNAEFIQGQPFVHLEDVLSWKKSGRRPKDLVDINLIEKYLESNKLSR